MNFATERGKPVDYVLVNDEATLLYLVNQGTLTFHPWLSRVESPYQPDFVLFDLDPGQSSFGDAVAVARKLHELLEAEGIASVPKTSGKSGIHVLVAWTGKGDFDEARQWALSAAKRVAEMFPDLATTEIRKSSRGERVYIDTLQNAKGHHAVPPYVVRAVAGAPVSMPLDWSELGGRLRPGQFTIRTALRRLSRQKSDPMAALLKSFHRSPRLSYYTTRPSARRSRRVTLRGSSFSLCVTKRMVRSGAMRSSIHRLARSIVCVSSI